MIEMDEQERKVVNEFCHLLEKSKQLFNGLRDLPQYGHKQWQSYFGRTFDVYTKLWKFQQQHRQILDSKYGLKRWQIGEIASKIGQLYYHYYLRTSETNYLNEAFSFYAAIRGRAYYSRTTKDDRSELMVKKLRYYARFIVVCLLLKRMKLVKDLVKELSKQIEEYATTYDPEDQVEWSMVLAEIKSFIEADNSVSVRDMDSNPIVLSHRLSSRSVPPLDQSCLSAQNLALQEIFIVGNCTDQVKFSELTIDMFRMLQSLEREPQEDSNIVFDSSPASGKMAFENGSTVNQNSKRENPHKYLLYKPTFQQLMVFLSSGFKELPNHGVMMVYISADGNFSPTETTRNTLGYSVGGVVTSSKREGGAITCSKREGVDGGVAGKRAPLEGGDQDPHRLYPGDLVSFTRKPLLLVVDSDNSAAFAHLDRSLFGQPCVVLMSPQEVPPQFHNQRHQGNLFTLFLHSPLMGLCSVCTRTDMPVALWNKCQQLVDQFLEEASKQLVRSQDLNEVYLQFYGDDFLRLLILRFLFCSTVLRGHRAFKTKRFQPSSQPTLPEGDLVKNGDLYRIVLDLASSLDANHLFFENLEK